MSKISGRMKEVPDCQIEFIQTELAWAAGFFDGEGTITAFIDKAGKNYKYSVIKLQVRQVDKRPLERFIKAVGIKNNWIYGPYTRPGVGQRIYTIQFATFERVQACVAILWKYLSEPKKEQYKRALKEYYK
jgi:hypothetical protein